MILPGTGLAANDWVRIGDGSAAEYRQVDAAPVAETVLVPLALPLSRSHDTGSTIDELARAADKSYTLLTASEPRRDRRSWCRVRPRTWLLWLPAPAWRSARSTNGEYRLITDVTGVTVLDATDSSARLHLDSGLSFGHPAAEAVTSLDLSAAPVVIGYRRPRHRGQRPRLRRRPSMATS